MSQGFNKTEIRPISKEWELVTIGDVCESISDTYNFKNKDKIVFLNTGDIFDGKVINSHLTSIKDLPGQAKKKINKNDILFSEIRPANKRFAFIDFDSLEYVVSTKLMVIRANERIFPRFLFHFLKNPIMLNYFQSLAESRSGTFPQITFDTIKFIQLSLPPMNEQIEIVNRIETMENKINLNNKINQTLEEIGKAIFKHWFVDFEFPDEQGRPYKSSGGEMVDSELGEIPKGWEVCLLPEVSKIVDCLHTKKPETTPSDLILLQVYNISEDGTLDLTNKYSVSDSDYKEWTKNILLKEGDCLVTNAGRVGAVGQVPSGFVGGIGRNITAIRPVNIKPTYLLRYLFSKYGMMEIKRLTDDGTVLNSLNVRGIKKIHILIPPKNILDNFELVTRSLRKKVEKNNSESDLLRGIRDSILPKLMSGKIRVKLEGLDENRKNKN